MGASGTGKPRGRSPGSAAMDRAIEAYRAALRAAAEQAIAEEACRIIDAEVVEVRLRHTAIHDRWRPRLQGLHDLEARLEENERAEIVRWRQLAADGHEVGRLRLKRC